jgi:hypothetical protein
VIGMTNMPEAKLAREAELPYASVAMVTDYDCWRADTDAVEVGNVLAVLAGQRRTRARPSAAWPPACPAERAPSPIDTVLDYALITPPDAATPRSRANSRHRGAGVAALGRQDHGGNPERMTLYDRDCLAGAHEQAAWARRSFRKRARPGHTSMRLRLSEIRRTARKCRRNERGRRRVLPGSMGSRVR